MGAGRGAGASSYPLPIPPHASGRGSRPSKSENLGEPIAAKRRQTDTHHLTWLALEPLTGRTHQLRVHCAAMGWPILGDSVYGSAPRTGGPGLHLHAREIVVPLYKNRAPIRVTAPVPPHMHETAARLRLEQRKPPGHE